MRPCPALPCPVLAVAVIMEARHQQLQGIYDYSSYSPWAITSVGDVSCTHTDWFTPVYKHRRYCQQPVSGRRMQRPLQY